MKKLRLKPSPLKNMEALTRLQLKKVLGGNEDEGSGSGSGSLTKYFCQCADGTSIYVDAPSTPQAVQFSNNICKPYTVNCYVS